MSCSDKKAQRAHEKNSASGRAQLLLLGLLVATLWTFTNAAVVDSRPHHRYLKESLEDKVNKVLVEITEIEKLIADSIPKALTVLEKARSEATLLVKDLPGLQDFKSTEGTREIKLIENHLETIDKLEIQANKFSSILDDDSIPKALEDATKELSDLENDGAVVHDELDRAVTLAEEYEKDKTRIGQDIESIQSAKTMMSALLPMLRQKVALVEVINELKSPIMLQVEEIGRNALDYIEAAEANVNSYVQILSAIKVSNIADRKQEMKWLEAAAGDARDIDRMSASGLEVLVSFMEASLEGPEKNIEQLDKNTKPGNVFQEMLDKVVTWFDECEVFKKIVSRFAKASSKYMKASTLLLSDYREHLQDEVKVLETEIDSSRDMPTVKQDKGGAAQFYLDVHETLLLYEEYARKAFADRESYVTDAVGYLLELFALDTKGGDDFESQFESATDEIEQLEKQAESAEADLLEMVKDKLKKLQNQADKLSRSKSKDDLFQENLRKCDELLRVVMDFEKALAKSVKSFKGTFDSILRILQAYGENLRQKEKFNDELNDLRTSLDEIVEGSSVSLDGAVEELQRQSTASDEALDKLLANYQKTKSKLMRDAKKAFSRLEDASATASAYTRQTRFAYIADISTREDRVSWLEDTLKTVKSMKKSTSEIKRDLLEDIDKAVEEFEIEAESTLNSIVDVYSADTFEKQREVRAALDEMEEIKEGATKIAESLCDDILVLEALLKHADDQARGEILMGALVFAGSGAADPGDSNAEFSQPSEKLHGKLETPRDPTVSDVFTMLETIKNMVVEGGRAVIKELESSQDTVDSLVDQSLSLMDVKGLSAKLSAIEWIEQALSDVEIIGKEAEDTIKKFGESINERLSDLKEMVKHVKASGLTFSKVQNNKLIDKLDEIQELDKSFERIVNSLYDSIGVDAIASLVNKIEHLEGKVALEHPNTALARTKLLPFGWTTGEKIVEAREKDEIGNASTDERTQANTLIFDIKSLIFED